MGAGIAGIETTLGLAALAGDRVRTTLVEPAECFTLDALGLVEPFGGPERPRVPIAKAAADVGAVHRRTAVSAVELGTRQLRLADGGLLPFDVLVVATGARETAPFPGVPTFRREDNGPVDALVARADACPGTRIGIAVPDALVWAVPAYELALLLARAGARVTLATPEKTPLEVFGGPASMAVASVLDDAGIDVLLGGRPVVSPTSLVAGDRHVAVDATLALPALFPVRIPGLTNGLARWLDVDAHGRVLGLAGVYAAGDITTSHIKQGALAAQQADAVAAHIARAAGARVTLEPHEPVLRARLVTGDADLWLRCGPGGSEAARRALWWPPTKVAGRFLSAWLDAHATGRRPATADGRIAPPSLRGEPPEVGRDPEVLASPFVP